MKPDEHEICLCFHVPMNKLVSYYHLHHPAVASQLSECQGSGTGCGWCVPFLERLHEKLAAGEEPDLGMSAEEYRQHRQEYKQAKRAAQAAALEPPPIAADAIELDLEKNYREIPESDKLS